MKIYLLYGLIKLTCRHLKVKIQWFLVYSNSNRLKDLDKSLKTLRQLLTLRKTKPIGQMPFMCVCLWCIKEMGGFNHMDDLGITKFLLNYKHKRLDCHTFMLRFCDIYWRAQHFGRYNNLIHKNKYICKETNINIRLQAPFYNLKAHL